MTRRRILYSEPTEEQVEPEITVIECREKTTGCFYGDYIWIFFIIIVVFLFGGVSFKY